MSHSSAVHITPISFEQRLGELRDQLAAHWEATSAAPPRPGPRKTRWQQWQAGRRAAQLVDQLIRETSGMSEHRLRQESWQSELRERLLAFGERHLDWPATYRRIEGSEQLAESASSFVRHARRSTPELDQEAIGQALRNVLIAQSLALLFGRPEIEPRAIHAYSLLYPLTDNYLDRSDVSAADKARFGQRLGRRLAGRPVIPERRREQRIDDQIRIIEATYPRHLFPSVGASLEAIHRAQMKSLGLQARLEPPSQRQLVQTSIGKGGASVLADGYLVDGNLSAREHDFSFAFGVVLQLLDDLQDVEDDRRAGHRTIFTEAADAGPLDQPTSRLFHFSRWVFADARRWFEQGVADLLERNSISLLVASIALTPHLFSRPFRRSIERHWPIRLRTLRRLNRRTDALSNQVLERSQLERPDRPGEHR